MNVKYSAADDRTRDVSFFSDALFLSLISKPHRTAGVPPALPALGKHRRGASALFFSNNELVVLAPFHEVNIRELSGALSPAPRNALISARGPQKKKSPPL
jgi:hypothetical protein